MMTAIPGLRGHRFRHYLGEDELASMAQVYNDSLKADRIDAEIDEEGLRRTLAPTEAFDPRQDLLLAEDDSGLVGWAWCSWRRKDERTYVYKHFVVSDPCRRSDGLTKALLTWNEENLREASLSHPVTVERRFEAWGSTERNDWTRLLEDAGYAPSMRLMEMVHDRAGEVAVPPMPDGMLVRPVRPKEMATLWQAMREAMSEDGQFCQDNWTEDAFHRWTKDTEGRTSLWQVAWHGEELAAGVLAEMGPSTGPARPKGQVGRVFVAKRFRKQGLAQALLARALVALHGAGAMMVCLDVDPDSETGAMRVYERAGFRPTGVLALYQKQL